MRRLLLCPLLLVICATATAVPASLDHTTRAPISDDRHFPEPPALRPAVAFWMRVYLEATTDGGFIHDNEYLDVVYERIQFGGEKDRRRRERVVQERKRHWENVLRRLSEGSPPSDASGAAVAQLFERSLGRAPEGRDFGLAVQRLRFQLGQRDKFRHGLIRSGAYEDAMRGVFRSRGLPEDLAFLPHVESSFNLDAYSKYGAAGIWQFMRSTGRRFLQIDYVVDERLDPMRSTRAAAQLLKENHDALGSWPLALTAYNHGRAGMARAKQQLGTSDIAQIARRYKSRTFGFASRNFYAQFLAARRIVLNHGSYFGDLQRDKPEVVDEVVLPFYIDVSDLQRHVGVNPDVVRDYNRSLRGPVFRSGKRIPEGFRLRLPAGTVVPDADRWLARIPRGERHVAQHRSNYYQVRRGDTLSRIAKRNRTSIGTLVALNNLPRKHKIFPGQVLQLPDRDTPRSVRRELPEPEPALVATAQAAQDTAPPAPPQPAETVAPQPAASPSVPAAEPRSEATVARAEPALPTDTTAPPEATPTEPALTSGASTPSAVPFEAEPTDTPEETVAEEEEPADGPAPAETELALTGTPGQPAGPSDGAAVAPTPPAALPPIAPIGDQTLAALPPGPGAATAPQEAPALAMPPSPGEDSPWRRINGNWVLVDSLETLGHFADWLEVSPTRLRKINKLSQKKRLRMGQKLKLDFARVTPETLLLRRMEYHKGIEEDFFGAYRVTGTTSHKLGRGDSLWQLSHKRYGVPIWLIQRYNPDLDLTALRPGLKLMIPTVEPLT